MPNIPNMFAALAHRQNLRLLLLLLLLGGISAWLQFGLLPEPGSEVAATQTNDPDYYIENFTSTGFDHLGKKYQLTAERLEHYPLDGLSLLVRPYIIQYDSVGAPRHIHADTGQLPDDDTEVLLTGNVKVTEGRTDDSGGAVVTSQKMRIRLKDDRG